MNDTFDMAAKTFQGLEQILAEELRALGAENVQPGRRVVTFSGDLATMYRANLCCRTALRILKPFYSFEAHNSDELYDKVKAYDWSELLDLNKTFSIDATAFGETFKNSLFATYRVKDAIVDWFQDRYGTDKRPKVRLQDADIRIDVHIADDQVTLSLDSSGESLHKRGWRVEQTEAPINEVLAAGILLMTGWRGETPLVDPMCGSGTFLVEAAMIAANINPGIYRQKFAFERWPDFNAELFEEIYNDDSGERPVQHKIYGADLSPKAVSIARRNLRNSGMDKYVELELRPLAEWTEAPEPAGVLVTNPPYGERLKVDALEELYASIGERLKHVFKGYHAWIMGYQDEDFKNIGLTPSQRIPLLNGSLECELREYVVFEGSKKDFFGAGGRIKEKPAEEEQADPGDRPPLRDRPDRRKPERKPFGRRERTDANESGDRERRPRRSFGDREFHQYKDRGARDQFFRDKKAQGDRRPAPWRPRREEDNDGFRDDRGGGQPSSRRRFERTDRPFREERSDRPFRSHKPGNDEERPRRTFRDGRPERPFREHKPMEGEDNHRRPFHDGHHDRSFRERKAEEGGIGARPFRPGRPDHEGHPGRPFKDHRPERTDKPSGKFGHDREAQRHEPFRGFQNQEPSLPAPEGPFMRIRKGWRPPRKDNDAAPSDETPKES